MRGEWRNMYAPLNLIVSRRSTRALDRADLQEACSWPCAVDSWRAAGCQLLLPQGSSVSKRPLILKRISDVTDGIICALAHVTSGTEAKAVSSATRM